MKKSEFLQIRISTEIKSALESKAETLGMTVSDYVRNLIFAAIQKE
jgi:antitoxin component of RelBE/YafQ-DinJ toxin-antitoxin module